MDLCALFATLLTAGGDPALTGREVIDRVTVQDRFLQERRKGFDYDLTITREKLDADRNVTSTEQEHTVVMGDRRPDFGTRPSSDAPESEAKKASQEEPFELLNIVDHYNYTLVGEEMANGVLCYKVAFTPKPNMPYDNREEKVLNAVAGDIWASTRDYSLVRNQGALLHPVSVAWIFASLEEMEFKFEAMPLPNGDYVPAEERYRYLVSIPFTSLHERDTRRMSNYRLAGVKATMQ